MTKFQKYLEQSQKVSRLHQMDVEQRNDGVSQDRLEKIFKTIKNSLEDFQSQKGYVDKKVIQRAVSQYKELSLDQKIKMGNSLLNMFSEE